MANFDAVGSQRVDVEIQKASYTGYNAVNVIGSGFSFDTFFLKQVNSNKTIKLTRASLFLCYYSGAQPQEPVAILLRKRAIFTSGNPQNTATSPNDPNDPAAQAVVGNYQNLMNTSGQTLNSTQTTIRAGLFSVAPSHSLSGLTAYAIQPAEWKFPDGGAKEPSMGASESGHMFALQVVMNGAGVDLGDGAKISGMYTAGGFEWTEE